jgi:tryptophan-rich sensory protein
MIAKLNVSPRSVFEILGIYALMLCFQAFSLYLMGSNSNSTIYLNSSFFLFEPENYRAIWALLYVFMTIAIWMDCKIQNRMISKSVILCFLQIVLTMILHYMFFLSLNSAIIFYGAILVNLVIIVNIFELSKSSYIAAAFIFPHFAWSVFLTLFIYQN